MFQLFKKDTRRKKRECTRKAQKETNLSPYLGNKLPFTRLSFSLVSIVLMNEALIYKEAT